MASAVHAMNRLREQLPVDRADARISAKVAPMQARVHEATRPSRSRKMAADYGSGNRIVSEDAKTLRDQARRLERDHDISRNALNILVQNTVGSGIDVIPAPRLAGGNVDEALAAQLRDLWDDWWDRPEVTWTHDFGKCQDLIARSLYRDGEAFFQTLSGPVAYLEHGSIVPLSIEMLEADMVPLDFNDAKRGILQGIERNAWGRRLAYHVYKAHPGDMGTLATETKRVSAEFMHHIALVDRITQVRGLSVFASVITRLEDIKDYEDSERIAAKVAASLSAQIVKGDGSVYADYIASRTTVAEGDADTPYRSLTMRPGMIADDLLPGESVEIIDSKRPNPNTETFRTGQLRAAAGGFGTSFSSLSLDYNGTYSAQRQELVEKWGAYQKAGEFYIAKVMRPIWRDFVTAAVLSGQVRMPRGWTTRNLSAASYVRPVMPWIDPKKETEARAMQEELGWVSPQKNVLEMGSDPNDVLQQTAEWNRRRLALGFQPKAAPTAPAAQPASQTEVDDA